MAAQTHMVAITITAGGAVSPNRFVDLDNTGKVVAASAGGEAVGVSDDGTYASGDAAAVYIYNGGKARVTASAAITAGDDIAVAAGGKAATATTTNIIVGKAVTSAAADGEVIEVLLVKAGRASA